MCKGVNMAFSLFGSFCSWDIKKQENEQLHSFAQQSDFDHINGNGWGVVQYKSSS